MLHKSKLLMAISGTSILIAIAGLTQFSGKTTAESSPASHLTEHAAELHLMHDRPGQDVHQNSESHDTHGNQSSTSDIRLLNPEIIQPNTLTTDDLQSYLGEVGHLVMLKQTKQPSQEDYIYAHAITQDFSGTAEFATLFPEPGLYKMWGQFNRNE